MVIFAVALRRRIASRAALDLRQSRRIHLESRMHIILECVGVVLWTRSWRL